MFILLYRFDQLEGMGEHDWSYCIRVRWWGEEYSTDDYSEGDYDEIAYEEEEDDYGEHHVCFSEPCDKADYDPGEEYRSLAQEEWAEEEDSRREMESEWVCCSDYSDSWARSEDDGWFYSDDD